MIEDIVLVRMALAAYLRDCGYRVVEAATTDEALRVIEQAPVTVDVVFSAVEVEGALSPFTLTQWLRKNRREIKIVMAGTPKSASAAAGRLCEEGPHLKKPYEPQIVENYIRRLLALRRFPEPQGDENS
ncbi:two-component system response regulator [Hyphomicrobium sp.]|uniref:response regulator n=1 Tax=Hyphomicrobium sp. TaxID=82 RepID=UPI0035670BB1